jgi:hypothetical protein
LSARFLLFIRRTIEGVPGVRIRQGAVRSGAMQTEQNKAIFLRYADEG